VLEHDPVRTAPHRGAGLRGDVIRRRVGAPRGFRNVTLVGNCLGSKEDLDEAIAAWAAGELDVTIDSVTVALRSESASTAPSTPRTGSAG
jgi:hypothetical protein